MTASEDSRSNQSNKGTRATGLVYSVRRESDDSFHGKHETRHLAVGWAAILGRLTGEDTFIRAYETMHEERDEPRVCDRCGYEDWYDPPTAWGFFEEGTFCEGCANDVLDEKGLEA